MSACPPSASGEQFALALRRLDGDLDRVGVRWALIGGLAVSVRAEPRFTRDVDVAVAIDSDVEAEAVAPATW